MVFAVPLTANRAAFRNRRGVDGAQGLRPCRGRFQENTHVRDASVTCMPGPLLAMAMVNSHVCRVNVNVNTLLAL